MADRLRLASLPFSEAFTAVQTGDNENGIYVCRDYLFFGSFPGDLAGKPAFSRQYGMNNTLLLIDLCFDDYPIANRRILFF